ncbi:MAG: PTS system nitrogen regulatory IIA component [Pseudohongiellaceae bacterium]|jgi:PTS system nitrogen regulatory IIA component
MELENILSQARCHCRMVGSSKKRILKTIGEHLSETNNNLDAGEVFDSLMAREQLGSTGIGAGIAIPHCRVPLCSNIVGMLITLKEPIDFDSIDNSPVDIIFVLIVPEQKTNEHIETLAGLAKLFSDEDFCYTLRNTQDSEDLYNIAITY